ncbi:MAG: orange carotenoid protein N-terminal domain-containing protein [Nostocaceae cyanobacterium]|nr:orange carotenoid protein N-terminal domain-containing protein [Nostocaceae cyanobacterium]
MVNSHEEQVKQYLPEAAIKVLEDFEKLSADEQLAALYFIYEQMGDSVTPAAPNAAEPNLAPMLLGNFFELSDEEQLQIMRDIVNRQDTEYSRAYGALKENNQLLVWFLWAEEMGDRVVDLPRNYKATSKVNDIVDEIEDLDFEQQISILREVAGNMGYTSVKPIPTQAETGKTSSL